MPMSRVASAARGLGALAALLFVGGPLGIQAGLLEPFAGFQCFSLGALLGVFAFLLGAIGLLRTREGAGREGRGRAMVGLGVGAAILAVVALAVSEGGDVPRIHDITTSPDDPPMFTTSPADRPAAYPSENASLQRDAYPDLVSIPVETPPAETVRRIAQVFESFGWDVTLRDEAAGAVEGNETTRIFRFVDDVVVRVRPSESGSVVDVRSRSRVGQSDVGANAARIRRLRDAL